VKKELGYFKSVSQIFDMNNQWIGYEYVVNIDENHFVIESYNSSGQLVSLKHQFNNPLNTGSVEDFIEYMNKVKASSLHWNLNYLEEMNRKPIDTSTSIDDAKKFTKFKNKN